MRKILFTTLLSLASMAFNAFAQGIDTPASALVGQASGLRISGSDGSLTGDFSATIRGLNSLRGDSSPLIIIDGVMLDNALPQLTDAFWQDKFGSQVYTAPVNLLGFISVEDIESVEVLKDISATAIYGSRGANGVIIIKTKRPRESQPKVEWKSDFGVNSMKGFMHDHHVMVNGSMGRNTFVATAFFDDENDGYSLRNNLRGGSRMAFEASANENVKFGVSAAFGVQQLNSMSTAAMFGASSMMLDKYQDKDISGWLASHDDYYVDYHAIADAHLDINLARYLSWKTRIGVNYQSNKRFNFFGEETDFGRQHRAAAAIVSSSLMNYHASTGLDFNIFAGTDHNIKASVAAEVSGNRNIYNTMNGVKLFSPILRAKSLNLSGSRAVIRTFKPSYFHLAAHGMLGYSWKQTAGVNATVSVDNTMRFDDAGVNVYPAAEAYFDAAQLMPSISGLLSVLKLKGGWGMAGHERVVPYGLFPRYVTSGDYPELAYGAQPVVDALDRLRTAEYNIGIQVVLLRGRIDMQVRYYNRTSTDAFSIYCFGQQNQDTGAWIYSDRALESELEDVISNRGVEVDLHAEIFDTRNFGWDVDVMAAFQSNQVSSLSKGSILGGSVATDGMQATVNAIGHPVSSIYGYDMDASGNPKDHTGDGKIAPEDRIILGRSQPKVFGTFGTTLRLWDFSLSALFDGAAGHSLLNMTRMVTDKAEHVTSEYVEKADFLRLGRLSLSYHIPFRRVKWIDSLDLSLTGYNLLCLTGYSGVNPDVDSFMSSNMTRGIDMGAMPMTKAVVLGVGVKF